MSVGCKLAIRGGEKSVSLPAKQDELRRQMTEETVALVSDLIRTREYSSWLTGSRYFAIAIR